MEVQRKCIVDDPENEGKYIAVYICPKEGCENLLISEDKIKAMKKEIKDGRVIAMKCKKCSEIIEF